MKNKATARLIFIIPILLLSAGCINYEHETYLNEDLSGRVEICVSLDPKEGIKSITKKTDATPEAKELMDNIVDAPSSVSFTAEVKEDDFLNIFNTNFIKSKSYKRIARDGKLYFYFTVEFDDIRRLYEGKKTVTITEDKNGLVTYTEYFEPFRNDRKEEGVSTTRDASKGFYFKYTLHMPRDIVSANTDKIDKNTATWDLPADEPEKDGFCIKASIKGENKILRWLRNFRKTRPALI